MPNIKKVGGKLFIGMTAEERVEHEKKKAQQEEKDKLMLALKEMQKYLQSVGFKPKYKL